MMRPVLTIQTRKEIYLLDRYSSIDYFRQLLNLWEIMLASLDNAMRNSKAQDESQSVWHDHVLPNFRETGQALRVGLRLLEQGDLRGLQYCSGPINDFRGQKDFGPAWMTSGVLQEYRERVLLAAELAQNIFTTINSQWNPGDLSSSDEGHQYCRINPQITVASNNPVTTPGIYLPDVDNSCAEFLSGKYGIAPPAIIFVREEVLFHPTTGAPYGKEKIFDEVPCTWTLVERTSCE